MCGHGPWTTNTHTHTQTSCASLARQDHHLRNKDGGLRNFSETAQREVRHTGRHVVAKIQLAAGRRSPGPAWTGRLVATSPTAVENCEYRFLRSIAFFGNWNTASYAVLFLFPSSDSDRLVILVL